VCMILVGYAGKGYAIPNVDNVKFTNPSVSLLQVRIHTSCYTDLVLSLQDCVQIGMDFVYS